MDLKLKGKVVLITGGSKGIGLACAHAFAEEGAKVAIASRDESNLKAAAASLNEKGFEVFTVVANLVEASQALNMVVAVEAALGAIDVLVNSAGAAKKSIPSEFNTQAWHTAMDAKFFTYVHAMDAVIESMAARRTGSIVNIVGSGGKVASAIHLPGGAANAALLLVSAGLANAWGGHGIRVNAINPGSTYTGRVKDALETEAKVTGKSEDEILRESEKRIPLGRYGKPEEVANTALFLASDSASYVTGAQVMMDGAVMPLA